MYKEAFESWANASDVIRMYVIKDPVGLQSTNIFISVGIIIHATTRKSTKNSLK